MDFCTGDAFPEWTNSLFVSGLVSGELRRLVSDGDRVSREETVFKTDGRIRDVVAGPDGFLYLVLNDPDRVVRLIPRH
jgi:aldose sugar dehydrogenase